MHFRHHPIVQANRTYFPNAPVPSKVADKLQVLFLSTELLCWQVLFADFSIEELNPFASSLNSTLSNEEILLFPNPVREQLFLSEAALNKYNIANIYNTNGQLILSEEVKNNPINITNLNAGIYLVELKDNKGVSSVVKIIVE